MQQTNTIQKHYSFADYYNWNDGIRWELIDGIPHAMAAASNDHQRISMRLSRVFSNFLNGKKCEVFAAPFDVRLNAHTKDNTIFQPDLTIVCDQTKLQGHGCMGAPDMVIEIISKSTRRMDRIIKLEKYKQAGVGEYWIVDQEKNNIDVFILKNGEYIRTTFGQSATITVKTLPELVVNVTEVFDI